MYTVTEVFLDESNKYRARIIIDNETKDTIFLKFNKYPTQEEIDSTTATYLANLAEINNNNQ